MTQEHTIITSAGTVRIRERESTVRGWKNKPRIYATQPSLDIAEDLMNRTRRPFRQWRKLVITALEESGLGIDTTRMGWDQHAGCSCGCSPGFVLDNHNSVVVGDMGFHNYDVYVVMPEGTPTVDETKAPRLLVEPITEAPAEDSVLEFAGAL
jgi:hypothetical protein